MTDGLQPHRGVLHLVLGIVSLIACPLLGIVPWVMANGDLRAMDQGQMDPTGRGMTQAGKILGIISVVWSAVVIVLVIVAMMTGLLFASAAAGAAGR